ncbi:hypothetical protein AB0L63_25520 [Nocardia sp. NPDC051990]|uniref:hypothetical protein n=1 Tax=Nocardia sp. NPDC051990 TaxID=3155285 RepID=UPI00341A74D8
MIDPQHPMRDLQTHVDIDPNTVTLVHPEGENDVVHEAVNAAQRAFQDSVDLFGPLGSTPPPPLDNDMLLLILNNPDLADGKVGTGPWTNEYLRNLVEQRNCIRDLIEEENRIAPKVKFIDDMNQGTLERIKAEIVFLNDAMRSARPLVDSNANDAGSYVHKSDLQNEGRIYLTDSDTQAVLRIISESTARVAGWVAECRRLNRMAAPTIVSPAPTSSAPPTDPAHHRMPIR